jgi:hypothetical protein
MLVSEVEVNLIFVFPVVFVFFSMFGSVVHLGALMHRGHLFDALVEVTLNLLGARVFALLIFLFDLVHVVVSFLFVNHHFLLGCLREFFMLQRPCPDDATVIGLMFLIINIVVITSIIMEYFVTVIALIILIRTVIGLNVIFILSVLVVKLN